MRYLPGDFAVTPNLNYIIEHLSHAELKMYLLLCRYADKETGACYPGNRKLADDMGFSHTRSVKRLTSILEKHGLIKKEYQYRKDGSQSSNMYYLELKDNEKVTKPVTPQSPPTVTPQSPSTVTPSIHHKNTPYITNFSDEKSVASFSENKEDKPNGVSEAPKAGTSSDTRTKREFTVEATDSEGTPVASSAGRPKSKKSKTTTKVIALVKNHQQFLDFKSLNDHKSADELFNLACEQIVFVRLKQVNPNITPDAPIFKTKLAELKDTQADRNRAGMLVDYISRYAFNVLPQLGEDYYVKKVTTLKHFKNSFPQLCAKAMVAVEEGVLDLFHYGTFTSSN